MVLVIPDDIVYIASSLQSSERSDVKLFYLQHFSKEKLFCTSRVSQKGKSGNSLKGAGGKVIRGKPDTSSSSTEPCSLSDEWDPSDPFYLRSDANLGDAHWTLDRLLCIGRVIRCDERFLWERLGPHFLQRFHLPLLKDSGKKETFSASQPWMNLWLEQQAVKWVRDFLCHRQLCECSLHLRRVGEDGISVEEEDRSHKDGKSSKQGRKGGGNYLVSQNSKKRAEKDGEREEEERAGKERKMGLLLWKELIHYTSQVIKPIGPEPTAKPKERSRSRSESAATVERGTSVASCSTASSSNSFRAPDNPVKVVPMHDLVEGSLRCASSLPAFSELLRIPLHQLFCRNTVKRYCALGRIIEASPALRPSLGAHEETFLVLCLVFERFLIGAKNSHWGTLLQSCPSSYPLVPSFWQAWELSEIEGVDMLEEVLKRKDELSGFHSRVQTVLPLLSRVLSQLPPSDEKKGTIIPQSLLTLSKLEEIFSLESLHWARATFDSRAFYLNLNGETVLVLSPTADMINHQSRSDVLVRCFRCASFSLTNHRTHTPMTGTATSRGNGSTAGGVPTVGQRNKGVKAKGEDEEKEYDFVLEIGAPLTREDVGRELWMSYGPLQNWELLQYYGFVIEDNAYDTLPFPLQDGTSPLEGSDDDGGAVVGEDANTIYQQHRETLTKKYFLNTLRRFWIGADGVPCPALLAMLRLHFASVQELEQMIQDAPQMTKNSFLPSLPSSFSAFSTSLRVSIPTPALPPPSFTEPAQAKLDPFTPLQDATEMDVYRAVEDTIQCILDLFSSTLEEDENQLKEVEEEIVAYSSAMKERDTTTITLTSTVKERKGDNAEVEESENSASQDSQKEEEGENDYLTSLRYRLSLKLRIHLKRIAHRCLQWCDKQKEKLQRSEGQDK